MSQINIGVEALALALCEEFVHGHSGPPDHPPLTSRSPSEYAERCRLYRTAAVVIGLLNASSQRPPFAEVLSAFERLVLAAERDGRAWSALRLAAADLEALLDGRVKPLGWSRRWFLAVGTKFTDPVELTLHAVGWAGFCQAVQERLASYNPQ